MKWLLVLLLPTMAWGKVKTEKVIYESQGVKMEGILAFDDEIKKPVPGILVFHEWMGNDSYSEKRAKDLASLGYVAFAADVYGQGVRPKNVKEAMAESAKYKTNRRLMRERALAALQTIKKDKRVKADQVSAIGFCFGGTVALELAREGAPVSSVVSFHGGLSTPLKAKTMGPKVLVLHGAIDPYVPEKEVEEFKAEMKSAGADWQFISYGNTVHSFTNPAAGNDPSKGAAFNELSAKRAWNHMRQFLQESLTK